MPIWSKMYCSSPASLETGLYAGIPLQPSTSLLRLKFLRRAARASTCSLYSDDTKEP